jgi:Na+/melibiose symporter-like transporter
MAPTFSPGLFASSAFAICSLIVLYVFQTMHDNENLRQYLTFLLVIFVLTSQVFAWMAYYQKPDVAEEILALERLKERESVGRRVVEEMRGREQRNEEIFESEWICWNV